MWSPSHPTDKETQAQRGEVTCPKSQSSMEAEVDLLVHCHSVVPFMASFYPLPFQHKRSWVLFLPSSWETEILCFIYFFEHHFLWQPWKRGSHSCRPPFYLTAIATTFPMCFSALALSLPQRKQAAVPPLLAACPGQVVQGVVYAQWACMASQCHLLRDIDGFAMGPIQLGL